jgi:hypothetical protein
MKSRFADLYPAYLTLLGGVLAVRSTPARFVTAVNQLRDRLYDGPVVGAFVRRELDRRLLSEENYLPFASRLELDQRADLGLLRMTLDQLEARDRLEGFFRLPVGVSLVPR